MPSTLSRLAVGATLVFIILAASLAGLTWWSQSSDKVDRETRNATGGISTRAIPIMIANGCAGCHTIAGVPGARGLVGLPSMGIWETHIYRRSAVEQSFKLNPMGTRRKRSQSPHGHAFYRDHGATGTGCGSVSVCVEVKQI